MRVIRYDTAAKFLARAKPCLEKAEAENNLILGISAAMEAHPERGKTESFLFTLEEGSEIVSAALMTPPYHLVTTRSTEPSLIALLDHLVRQNVTVTGVLGPSGDAKFFADCWKDKTGNPYRPGLAQRIYSCSSVIDPRFASGQLRSAAQDDATLLLQWCREFILETGVPDPIEECNHTIPNKIADGLIYVWDDEVIVSTAAVTGETPHGVRIGLVYTPSHLRKRGYATSCVAAVTKRMLDSGKKFCCLYTDLANPTSNSIYQKIGYQPVCDVQDWIFE